MTSKLTREQVVALIAEHSYDSALVDALEYLLAAMDSEPVYQVFEPSDGRWVDVDDEEEMIRLRSIGGETRTLYTAPPSTVVDSEPVAWEVKGILCHTLEEASKYVGVPEPLYAYPRLESVSAEPVAYMYDGEDGVEYNGHNEFSGGGKGIPLYRHAQQPVVQPMMFIDGNISSDDADKLAKVIQEFNEEDERPLAKMARIIRENPHPTNECDMPKSQLQPEPVVPEEATPDSIEILASARRRDHAVFQWDEDQRNAAADSWNAFRAAMLQELKKKCRN